MKTLLKLSPVFLFLFVAALTSQAICFSPKWTAQNPPWTSTVDTHVDVNAEVLTAWRSISGNNGAMCQAIWKNLGPGISGAGNCIRNLYNTGNTCSFDQNPEISVDSRNNKATITLRTNNHRLTSPLLCKACATSSTPATPTSRPMSTSMPLPSSATTAPKSTSIQPTPRSPTSP